MTDRPTNNDLKKFKLTLFILPIIPAVILYFKNHINISIYLMAIFWITLLVVLIGGFINKNIEVFIYQLIHKFLKYIGIVLSSIALTFIWFCAILPTALFAKLKKRDRLVVKKQKVNSYWKDVQEKEQFYENQF